MYRFLCGPIEILCKVAVCDNCHLFTLLCQATALVQLNGFNFIIRISQMEVWRQNAPIVLTFEEVERSVDALVSYIQFIFIPPESRICRWLINLDGFDGSYSLEVGKNNHHSLTQSTISPNEPSKYN